MESNPPTIKVSPVPRPMSGGFQLNISYQVKDIHILLEDDIQTLIDEDSFAQFKNISSNHDASFLNKGKDEIRHEVLTHLASLQIDSPVDHQLLADSISNRIIEFAFSGCCLQPKFKIVRERRFYYSLLGLQGRTDYGMVPTDPKYLSLLLKPVEEEEAGRESMDAKKSCTICFEDIVDSATSMPCNHMFHNECIVTWLQQSHYCPICRFEMPTEAEA